MNILNMFQTLMIVLLANAIIELLKYYKDGSNTN